MLPIRGLNFCTICSGLALNLAGSGNVFTGSFRKSASFLGSALFLFLAVGLFPVNAQEVETVKTPVETSVKAANPEVSAEKIAETPDKPAVSSGWRQRFFGFKPKSKTRDKALVTTTPSAPEASEELHSTPKPSKRLAYAKPKKPPAPKLGGAVSVRRKLPLPKV